MVTKNLKPETQTTKEFPRNQKPQNPKRLAGILVFTDQKKNINPFEVKPFAKAHHPKSASAPNAAKKVRQSQRMRIGAYAKIQMRKGVGGANRNIAHKAKMPVAKKRGPTRGKG